MMTYVMTFGNSAAMCEITYTYTLKYKGSEVTLTEDGACTPRVIKGSDKCTCTSQDQVTYQFSVDADGIVTLKGENGSQQKLTPVPGNNGSSSGGGMNIMLIVAIAGGAVVALLLVAGGVFCYRRQQQQSPEDYVDANRALIGNNGEEVKSSV